MNSRSVDIVIAARNESKHLGSCLHALTEQVLTDSAIKIYVVDDGSTDNTAEIASAFGAVVLSTNPPGGISAARNLALQHGSGDFVGFLDAHCVAPRNWVSSMLARLCSAEEIGGCQGSFDYVCTDARSARLLKYTQFASDLDLLEQTVSGSRSAFPWAVTGNSMFRRKAVQLAGFFDEDIYRCEDADFSWRVVWCGYRLEFVPQARVVHVDENSMFGFLLKHYRYGEGAAQLAHAYNLHGERKRNRKSKRDFAGELVGVLYNLGYSVQDLLLKIGMARRPMPRQFKGVALASQFRQPFQWSDDEWIQISENVIYWLQRADRTVVVNPNQGSRLELDGTSCDIFTSLTQKLTRAQVVSIIVDKYVASQQEVSGDVDALIEQLVEAQVLKKLPARV